MKKILFTILTLMSGISLNAQDNISIADFSIQSGETKTLSIELNNSREYTAFQMDVRLPYGLEFATTTDAETGEDVLDISLDANRKKSSHQLSYNSLGSGATRIVAYSGKSVNFAGNSGALVHMTVKATTYISEGNHQIEITGIRFTENAATGVQEYVFDDYYKTFEATPAPSVESLRTLYTSAQRLYSKGFEVKITSNEMTQDANFNNMGLVTDAANLWTNAQDPYEGPIENLLDNDAFTYFHSSWHDEGDDYHYIQADLGHQVGSLAVKLSKRDLYSVNADYSPTVFQVYAKNATDANWVNIGPHNVTYMWENSDVETVALRKTFAGALAVDFQGQTYQQVRLVCTNKKDFSHKFFALSEMRFYEGCKVDTTYTQEFQQVSPGMRDALSAALVAAGNAIAENNLSLDVYNNLDAAYNAFKQNFTDPNDSIFGGDYEALTAALQEQIEMSWGIYYDGEITEPMRNELYSVIRNAEDLLSYANQGMYDELLEAYQYLLDSQTAADENKKLLATVILARDEMDQAYSDFYEVVDDIEVLETYETICYEDPYNMTTTGLLVHLSNVNATTAMLNGTAVTTPVDTISIVVDKPGTLAEKMLAATSDLSNRIYLTVSGQINNDDVTVIEGLIRLQGIDMSGLSIAKIPNDMFRGRVTLKEAILPTTVKTIEDGAFFECKSLQEINLPEGLTYIGSQAFAHCERLTSITLPSSVKKIEYESFKHNKNLESIHFSEGLEYLGDRIFYDCPKITSIDLPNTLLHMGDRIFGYCHGLTEVELPASLMRVQSPFFEAQNIKSITSYAIVPPICEYGQIMDGRDGEVTLYVPSIAVNNYRGHSAWCKFKEIVPLDMLPEVINIYTEHSMELPASVPASFKPNVNLVRNPNDEYKFGALTLNGGISTFSMNSFTMNYDLKKLVDNYEWTEVVYDDLNDESYYVYGTTGYNALLTNVPMRADNVKINLRIRQNQWAFLSFPFDVKVSDIVPMEEDIYWVIREYSGEARANGEMDKTWVDVAADGTLQAGKGYILYATHMDNYYYSDEANFVVQAQNNESKNNIFANGDCQVALTEYYAEFNHNRSWNLIGNPYPCFYDTRHINFSAPITVWNDRNRTYDAFSLLDDSYILHPGEAFFVQAPLATESIAFVAEGRQTNREVSEMEEGALVRRSVAPAQQREVYNLLLGNGKDTDKTRFVLNESAVAAYEMERDASKFMSSDKQVSQIYTIEQGINMSINERPMGNGQVALGMYFAQAGTYTLMLDTKANRQITLVDKETGTRTVLNDGGYKFTAGQGAADARFVLVMEDNNATGVDNVAAAIELKTESRQIIVDAPAEADIVVYTLGGMTVTAVRSAHAVINVQPGLYVVKVNGQANKVRVTR